MRIAGTYFIPQSHGKIVRNKFFLKFNIDLVEKKRCTSATSVNSCCTINGSRSASEATYRFAGLSLSTKEQMYKISNTNGPVRI